MANATKLFIRQREIGNQCRHIGKYCDEFKKSSESELENEMKRINLVGGQLSVRNVRCIVNVLENVEYVSLSDCRTNNLHERFLSFCAKLKVLRVYGSVNCDNGWLNRMYPTLKHLTWFKENEKTRSNNLKKIFELNPNVRSFATNSEVLRHNVSILKDVKSC